MQLRNLKNKRVVFHFLYNLLKYDQQRAATETSLVTTLRDAGFDQENIGDIDITPESVPTADRKEVIHDVGKFCRIIAEYIGDYITPDVLVEHPQLNVGANNILAAFDRSWSKKPDAQAEKAFIGEWAEILEVILAEANLDDESGDVIDEGLSLDNISDDGELLEDDVDDAEDSDVDDDIEEDEDQS